MEDDKYPGIYVPVPIEFDFEFSFRTRGERYFYRSRHGYVQGPIPAFEDSLERWLQEATLANAQRWSQKAHADAQVMLSLFTEDCPHPNPEDDPKYDGVEFFRHRVTSARWNLDRRFRRRPADPYTLAFMEAAAAAHPLVAEFEAAMSEWDDHHGRTCDLSEMGTTCRACAEAHEEWDEDGMEPSGCRLEDDVREAYDEFWYANGERA